MTNDPKRYFCFTINHPTPDDDKQLLDLSSDTQYMCYGKEHFQTEGATPHYQGYLELSKPQRFSWLKKRLSRAHLELRQGSRTQARDYCFKECDNPVQYGEWIPDRRGQRNDLISIRKQIEEGSSEIDIAQEHFGSWCRYRNSFNAYKDLLRMKKRKWETEVIVLWGPPGSGKTRRVYEEASDVHDMHFSNGFWSPYNGEETVLIDDFDDTMLSRNTFLKLTDRYPFKLRILHGWREWLPKTIYITSNFHPHTWYAGDEAVRRRIKKIVRVTG